MPKLNFTSDPDNLTSAVILFLLLALTGSLIANLRFMTAAYLLPGNKTDSCYEETFSSDRAECIERLLTMYYGDFFSAYCQNSAQVLAIGKCKGCPWDNINVSAITPEILRNLNRSELFHAAAPSCSVARYLSGIASGDYYLYLSFFGCAIPMFSAIFLAKIDANGSPTTPHVFGSRLKEPIYFVFLWLLFFVGFGVSAAGHEPYNVCHDLLSNGSLMIGDWINLPIMLWTTLWRCRYLEARDRPEEVISCEPAQCGIRDWSILFVGLVLHCFFLLFFSMISLKITHHYCLLVYWEVTNPSLTD